MANEITNADDIIDSRDVIARIAELEETKADAEATSGLWSDGDEDELVALQALAKEAEGSPDWSHGETLIRESYFTDYIEDLIGDCYELPQEITSGAWPYRHITIDFDGAAEEAKADYIEANFAGITYLIRA